MAQPTWMVQPKSLNALFHPATRSPTTLQFVSRASFLSILNLTRQQVNQPGTYWFHSHVRGQYPDGLRAPLIVHDPDSPFQDVYDEEVVLTFSDWYDTISSTLLKSFLSYTNPTGAEPVPDAAL